MRNHSYSSFNNSSNWTILSKIEADIKKKIEEHGVKLGNWDIQINYGVKTGCNEAFIIDKTTRDRLIKEDPKCDEIIRPILRGKDIGRYTYVNNNLFLICTFPSKHINIDLYSSIKNHFIHFGKQKLEQTGIEFFENGEKKKARKKTNNLWFETQDSISYWNDFNKQKIIYPCIMGKASQFMFDIKGEYHTIAPGNIISGNNLLYLLSFLNTKIVYFVLRKFYMGGGIEGELKTNRLRLLPVPKPTDAIETAEIIQIQKNLQETLNKERYVNETMLMHIEKLVANCYHLTCSELEYIMNAEF